MLAARARPRAPPPRSPPRGAARIAAWSCARRAISAVVASSETSRSSVCTSVPKRTPEGRPGARSVAANAMRGVAPYGPFEQLGHHHDVARPAAAGLESRRRDAAATPRSAPAPPPPRRGSSVQHLLLAQPEVLGRGRPERHRVPPHHLVARRGEAVQTRPHRGRPGDRDDPARAGSRSSRRTADSPERDATRDGPCARDRSRDRAA